MSRESKARPGQGAQIGVSPIGSDDSSSVGSGYEDLKPLALGARGLGHLLDVSRSHVLKLDASGRLPAGIRLGRRKVWSVEEIQDWLRAGAPSRDTWEVLRAAGRGREKGGRRG